jgi:hypothetical protein
MLWTSERYLGLRGLKIKSMPIRVPHQICVSCRRAAHCPPKNDRREPRFRPFSNKRHLSSTQSSQFAEVSQDNVSSGSSPATTLYPTAAPPPPPPPATPSPEPEDEGQVLQLNVTLHQAGLHSSIDDLRDRLLGGLRARHRFEHLRDPNLVRGLATPVELGRSTPEQIARLPHLAQKQALETVDEHRRRVHSELSQKGIRKLIREQLLRVQTPRDVLQIVAVAMQRRQVAQEIATLDQSITAAMYRVRHHASDPDVLSVLNVIIDRFRREGLPIRHDLITFGLRFAARARSLPAMKRYLKDAKEMNVHISGDVFRSIVAKFSIGSSGIGEIRNGRWKRDHLIQVLLGFDDMDPRHPYNLGVFLKRDDWAYLHSWVAVLARCKAVDKVWNEWQWWRDSDMRKASPQVAKKPASHTVRTRGDAWMVEQLLFAGAPQLAWEVFYETELSLCQLPPSSRRWLVEHPEHVREWDEPMKQALLEKYAFDLAEIEEQMGIQWISQGEEGYHKLPEGEDMEEALEKLSGGYTPHLYGYPED